MVHTALLLVMRFQGAEEGVCFFLGGIVYGAVLGFSIEVKAFVTETLHRAIDVCYIYDCPS